MTSTALPPARTSRWMFWRSPADQPTWARPALLAIALVAGTIWALGMRLGLVHNYYSIAVKAMSTSWRAFFLGALDPAASITVDKLPLAFQVEALFARVLGYGDLAILLPQVLESVVTVLVLYRVVRRWIGPRTGLVAAGLYATTPIVAALAHAEISDTLLTMLLVLAADAWFSALRTGRLRWLLLSGAWVGLAFQAKMVQAWGVLPALGLAYLLFAPVPFLRRLWHTLLAGVVAVGVSVSWMAAFSLLPASVRPYADGSQTNSIWETVFVYNLSSRYSVGGTRMGGPGGENIGWTYLLQPAVATQAGWLYPLALAGLVAGLWWRRRKPRTDVVRAGFVMWGLWLTVHAVAFSTGRVAHSFYVVSMAPALAALAAGGLALLWRAFRRGGLGAWALPLAAALTLAWQLWLSRQYPDFRAWLTPAVAVLGALALLGLVGALVTPRLRTRAVLVGTGAALGLALTITPATWAASTIEQGYSGSVIGPAAGPADGMGGPGRQMSNGSAAGGQPPGGQAPGGQAPGGRASDSQIGGRGQRPTGGGGMDGAPGSAAELISWLENHEPGSRYLLAVQGSQQAGAYIKAGASVLPMGGFSGSVPFPSTDELAKLVSSGQLRYVLLGGQGGMGGPGGGNAEVSSWVSEHCTAVSDSSLPVSGLYDCRG